MILIFLCGEIGYRRPGRIFFGFGWFELGVLRGGFRWLFEFVLFGCFLVGGGALGENLVVLGICRGF